MQTPLEKGSPRKNKQKNSTIHVEEHDMVKINMEELYPSSKNQTQLKALCDPDVSYSIISSPKSIHKNDA